MIIYILQAPGLPGTHDFKKSYRFREYEFFIDEKIQYQIILPVSLNFTIGFFFHNVYMSGAHSKVTNPYQINKSRAKIDFTLFPFSLIKYEKRLFTFYAISVIFKQSPC